MFHVFFQILFVFSCLVGTMAFTVWVNNIVAVFVNKAGFKGSAQWVMALCAAYNCWFLFISGIM